MRFSLALAALLVTTITFAPASVSAAVPSVDKPVAVLRALDKVTARVEEIEVQIENPYKFGTIFITAHACRVTTPEETPESAAFLDISEFKQGQSEVSVFRGWMFASSPALSAMEHPVYDLWLIGCKGGETAAPATPSADSVVVMPDSAPVTVIPAPPAPPKTKKP
ncbi:MAG TPA: DUF2155 domain-containing protein [Rhodospirillaceae bacterium]|nr:DUF2155 domain-containing protein [Rhodospirillaceae bacterium]